MKNFRTKLLYEWHLRRAERINALLGNQAFLNGKDISQLIHLRRAHTEAMAKLPNAWKTRP